MAIEGDLEDVREMITSPHSVFGLSDATYPTTAIAHWTRDRTRGEKLPLEFVVHQQTQRTPARSGGGASTAPSRRPATSPTST